MELDILSDIHADYYDDKIIDQLFVSSKSKILIIAGDVCSLTDSINYLRVLRTAKQYYKHVLVVPGNHEYYKTSIEEGNCIFEEYCKKTQCISLNNKIVNYNNINFLGTTLWSDAKSSSVRIRDYKLINDFSNRRRNQLYIKSKNFIEKYVNKSTVVVTHHLPSKIMVHPRYKHCPYEISSHYYSNLDDLVDKSKAWICGHSHQKMTRKIKNTWCYLNPLGYPHENMINKPVTITV